MKPLNMKANKPQSLYIHIPFCDHICSYCDFTKLFYFEKYEKPYLDAIEEDGRTFGQTYKDSIIQKQIILNPRRRMTWRNILLVVS